MFTVSKHIVERSSNLELYRIIVMLLIVAHHYVVNSGLTDEIAVNPMSSNSLFYLMFGAWGKTGINCFIMITGYFMCTKQITLSKFLKLFLWILTYSILITICFSIFGYKPYGTLTMWISTIPIRIVETNFDSCFLLLYLCIPFLNILIKTITKKQYVWLIALLLFIYTLHSSIPSNYVFVSLNYFSWFIVVYLIASYIRFYQSKYDNDTKFWLWATIVSWSLSILSILCINYYQAYCRESDFLLSMDYFFISDSNSILALTNGITSFMLFKNLKIKNSRIINTISASSFGVLLIHANSDTMRSWLWKDTVDCVGHYDSQYYWLYSIAVVITIYIVCTLIDIIRIHTIETPLVNTTETFCRKLFKRFQ